MVMRIKAIYRYPVKSMQGESLQSADLGVGGIALDRGWALKDEETGNILSAKREGALLECSARFVEGDEIDGIPPVEISLPGGRKVRSDDPAAGKILSDYLGRSVTLWPLQPPENLDHYRLRMDPGSDLEQELRTIFALEADESLPDLEKFPPEILAELMEYSSPRGTYFDAFPLNILTEASLRHFSRMMPGTTIGVERFRPGILVEDDEDLEGTVEFGWVGKNVKIGEAEAEIVMECPRCVMTTRAQPGYEKAPGIMRTLVRELDHNLSVYARVTAGARIALGDEVRPL